MKVTCSVCGKRYTGKIPKGGDGSILFPRKHNIIYIEKAKNGFGQGWFGWTEINMCVCDGSYREGIEESEE